MTAPEALPIGRSLRSDGQRTHSAILEAATRVASLEGIGGLTIRRLAKELGVSKSGLYAHFGSKEKLQLETVEAAIRVLNAEVFERLRSVPPGIRQVEAMIEAYLSYLERWVFPGGCFFASVLAEVDARPGPVRDRIVEFERERLATMEAMLSAAQELGEIAAEVDCGQFVFEIAACLAMSNYHLVLLRDPTVLTRGRRMAAALVDRSRGPGPRGPRA